MCLWMSAVMAYFMIINVTGWKRLEEMMKVVNSGQPTDSRTENLRNKVGQLSTE